MTGRRRQHERQRRSARLAMVAAWACLSVGVWMTQGCGVGYVTKSSYYQMEMLASRVPVKEVQATCALTPREREALKTVQDVKAFGRTLGLSGSANYDTVAVGWQRTVWNISASDPVSFSPETWWFPIVGTVPYLGFFTDADADAEYDALKSRGLDVYKRSVGAYSTLGWFEDPVLLHMLAWSTFELAEVILHELTHATVWIPGSVAFNESFANFVGQEAAVRYMRARFGDDAPQVRAALEDLDDERAWVALLREVYHDLDAVYTAPGATREARLAGKRAILEGLPERVDRATFHHPARFRYAASHGVWNNARLIQFKTYNANRAWFQTLLEREGGDLLAFIQAIKAITAAHDGDPYDAVQAAAEQQQAPAP